MQNEQTENIISNENDEQELDLEAELDYQEDGSNEDVESLKKKTQTLEAQKAHWKKKYDEMLKGGTPKEAPKKDTPTISNQAQQYELSPFDFIAIAKSDIEQEDIGDVMDYAKLKGVSFAEAIKSPIVKTIIASKKEERTTANATNTGSARRANTRLSDEELLSRASRGELPESDEDLDRLFYLRRNKKK